MTEDKMVGWHSQLDGHEFEQAPGSLACCSPWGRKEWDMTEQLNLTDGALNRYLYEFLLSFMGFSAYLKMILSQLYQMLIFFVRNVKLT